jgi:gluconolactonase
MDFISDLFVKSSSLLIVFSGFGLAQDYGGPRNDVPASIVAAGTKIQAVLTKHPLTGQALGFCEGPAIDAEGNLFFSEPATNTIFQVAPGGQATVFYTGLNDRPYGMEFDPQGNLLACTRGAIVRFTKAGIAETVVASGNGIDFKDLQDITIGSNGAIYATNYKAGSMIFYISPDRKTIKQIPGVANPTGIEWLEEKKILYVSDFDAHTTWQFDVGDDGALSNKRSYVPDIPGAYGITMDEKEDVYIAGFTQGSVHLYSAGKKDPFLGHIDVKGSPNANGNNSNLVFGGKDNKTLFMTGNGGCFKIQLVIAGRKRPNAASPILKNDFFHTKSNLAPKPLNRWDISGRINLRHGPDLDKGRANLLIFVGNANPVP